MASLRASTRAARTAQRAVSRRAIYKREAAVCCDGSVVAWVGIFRAGAKRVIRAGDVDGGEAGFVLGAIIVDLDHIFASQPVRRIAGHLRLAHTGFG